jgi:hypothetical protein
MIWPGSLGTFAYNWALVLPLFARFALDAGAEGFGALNMAMGVGSTIGAFALATRLKASMRLLLAPPRVRRVHATARAPTLSVTLAMLVFCLGVLSASTPPTTRSFQIEAREELRGRCCRSTCS